VSGSQWELLRTALTTPLGKNLVANFGPNTAEQGQLLPFHRLFVYAHEYALEAECGYAEASRESLCLVYVVFKVSKN